jgi:hypothetical protein
MCPIKNTLLYPAKCFYLPKRQMGGPQLLHFMNQNPLSLPPPLSSFPLSLILFFLSFSLHSFFLYPYPICVCFTWISTYNLHMFVYLLFNSPFYIFPFNCIFSLSFFPFLSFLSVLFIFDFLKYFIQHYFICHSSDSTVSEYMLGSNPGQLRH